LTCPGSRAPRDLEKKRQKLMVEEGFGEEKVKKDEEDADEQVGHDATSPVSCVTSPLSCVASPGHKTQKGLNGVAQTQPGEETVEETEDEEVREDKKDTRRESDQEEAAVHMQPQYRNAPRATSTCISVCVARICAYWILCKQARGLVVRLCGRIFKNEQQH
jgi:hypothetical protein